MEKVLTQHLGALNTSKQTDLWTEMSYGSDNKWVYLNKVSTLAEFKEYSKCGYIFITCKLWLYFFQENFVKAWEARVKICHVGNVISYTLFKQKTVVTLSAGWEWDV